MLDDFVLRAGLAGIGVALVAGPLGSFVVWRRMAVFGEALANTALLGVVFATLLHLHILIGVALFTGLLAVGLLHLERRRFLPLDTLLSMFAHGALAVGLLVLSRMDRIRFDVTSFLFGDVLATSPGDLGLIAGLLLVIGIGLARIWRPLLSATVHPELAAVEGVPVERVRFLFTLMLAGLIAIGMKIVGMLLIVSLLVVPAAAARQLARTPEQMALLAATLGCLAVLGGLLASLELDLPTGPAMVAAAVLLFAATSLLGRTRHERG
ncbi:metal ABC transporter permease [Benzoatithermus flavus]|uniref:High-affinity zinc uptake system membrane protein ZnuB n=1 Tax=Benzoatithermus flavus TaxID=3108223 RepID=A0ABU8XKJ5_9PROT